MGVDVIEAGFANASKGDYDAIVSVAKTIKDSVVCSLARAHEADIRIIPAQAGTKIIKKE